MSNSVSTTPVAVPPPLVQCACAVPDSPKASGSQTPQLVIGAAEVLVALAIGVFAWQANQLARKTLLAGALRQVANLIDDRSFNKDETDRRIEKMANALFPSKWGRSERQAIKKFAESLSDSA